MSGERMLVKSTWPGFGSYRPWLVLLAQDLEHPPLPHMQKHLQRKAMLGETESLSPHMAGPHPGDGDLHIYQHILVRTFLPIKLKTSGFLFVAYYFYAQRIPALLGFIPQPFPEL